MTEDNVVVTVIVAQADSKRCAVGAEAVEEWERARAKFPAMSSAHYGYAVLKEEVDELWDAIKAYPKKATLAHMREEAIQVAAMALAFVHEVCDGNITAPPTRKCLACGHAEHEQRCDQSAPNAQFKCGCINKPGK